MPLNNDSKKFICDWRFILFRKITHLLIFAGTVALMSKMVRANDNDVARDSFRKAQILFEQGKYFEASMEFRRAYLIKPSWKIRYNIGQSEVAAKRYGLALEEFEAFLAEGGDSVGVVRERDVAEEIELLKTKVGSIKVIAPEGCEVLIDRQVRGKTPLPGNIRISAGVLHTLTIRQNTVDLLSRQIKVGSGEVFEVSIVDSQNVGSVQLSGPSGAKIFVDEVLSGTLPLSTPLQVSAGDVHELVLSFEGKVLLFQKITVEKDELITVQVPSRKTAPTAASDTNDALPDKRKQSVGQQKTVVRNKRLKTGAIVLMASGGAAIILGSALGIGALKASNDMKNECNDSTNTCDSEMRDTFDRGKTMGTLSNVFLPVGGALMVTGIVLGVLYKKKSERLSVSATPIVSSRFSGIGIKGDF